jgi:chemotaxis protein methyltransferase CheR
MKTTVQQGLRIGDAAVPQRLRHPAGRRNRPWWSAGCRSWRRRPANPSVDRYVEKLVRGDTPGRRDDRVIDRLTTNETYFFREPQHFNDLGRRLAARRSRPRGPGLERRQLLGRRGLQRRDAGLPRFWADARWQVIGTDLSTAVVDAAQRGLYPLERARMVPRGLPQALLPQGPGPARRLAADRRELRERVRFMPANLMQELPQELPMFDVIFLRNVLIYFDNEAKAQIVRRCSGGSSPTACSTSGTPSRCRR